LASICNPELSFKWHLLWSAGCVLEKRFCHAVWRISFDQRVSSDCLLQQSSVVSVLRWTMSWSIKLKLANLISLILFTLQTLDSQLRDGILGASIYFLMIDRYFITNFMLISFGLHVLHLFVFYIWIISIS
jgi:hypothetical protein